MIVGSHIKHKDIFIIMGQFTEWLHYFLSIMSIYKIFTYFESLLFTYRRQNHKYVCDYLMFSHHRHNTIFSVMKAPQMHYFRRA